MSKINSHRCQSGRHSLGSPRRGTRLAAPTGRHSLRSPDGAVQIKVFVRDARLHYEVTFRNKPVIEPSPLVVTVDGTDITERAGLSDVKRYKVNETYPSRDDYAVATNRCNGATIAVTPGSNTRSVESANDLKP